MGKKGTDFYRPHALKEVHNFEKKLDRCVVEIEDGANPRDVVMKVFDISIATWHVWLRNYEKDVANDWTRLNSNLILLMEEVSKADLYTKGRLEKRAVKRALTDESPDMLKFVLERRYDYVKKQKQDVEVGAKEDTTFNINITESKPRDD